MFPKMRTKYNVCGSKGAVMFLPIVHVFYLLGCGNPNLSKDTSHMTNDIDKAIKCNGLEQLCDRTLHEVAFLRAHNAHASQERGYSPFAMNHFFAIPTQLRDGVRSINLDLYDQDGELLFCHGFCELGSQIASELVQEIFDFLKENPYEVIIIDLQDESNGRSAEVFVDLEPYLWVQEEPFESWPTLREMIEKNTRIVLFGNPRENDPKWLLSKSQWWYSNGWYYENPEDLNCDLTENMIQNGFYEVTHVLTNPLAHPDLAESINHQPMIGEHLQKCISEVGFVNFLSVDFYSIGDGIQVIHALNQGKDVIWNGQ